MTYREFLRRIRTAGLTLGEFATALKMNRISLSNYAKNNRVPSHLAVIVTLLAAMNERNIDFIPLLQGAQITAKKPRGGGFGKFGGDRQQRLF